MSRTISLLAASAVLLFSCLPVSAVTINWTPVGNPGNGPDTTIMQDGTTGYGSVGYSFNIDKYDVTNSQYVELLNAKDPDGANTLGLYNHNMNVFPYGGINYTSGAAIGNKYSVISGDGNRPVNWVSWYDAIRFANWLNNGQGSADTETGAYTLGALYPNFGGLPVTPPLTHNAGAKIWLPTENEWYKAAYYNSRTDSYFQYATSSNALPTASVPTGAPNSANYNYAVNIPTDVGAYSGTTSPYGLYDMGGNVWQWNESLNESLARGPLRVFRGGSFDDNPSYLLSSIRGGFNPENAPTAFGFRVASVVPEPTSVVLAGLGFGGFAAWSWRRRKKLGRS